MKIALCISGGLRNFKDTFYSFDYFLLRKYDVDVFFYGLENKEGAEKNAIDLQSLFAPKNFVINNSAYYDRIKCPYSISSSYYAFYNVMKCNELKKQYEQNNNIVYDLVIRARLDYFWFRHLTDEEILLAHKLILTPEEWSFKNVNNFARFDGFAIGPSAYVDLYSCLYHHIDEYCRNLNFHPESLCGYHMDNMKIPHAENKRCVVFEYPTTRGEKYIYPYKFIKYFIEPQIHDENEFLKNITDRRKLY